MIPKERHHNIEQELPVDSTVKVEVVDYDEATGGVSA